MRTRTSGLPDLRTSGPPDLRTSGPVKCAHNVFDSTVVCENSNACPTDMYVDVQFTPTRTKSALTFCVYVYVRVYTRIYGYLLGRVFSGRCATVGKRRGYGENQK